SVSNIIIAKDIIINSASHTNKILLKDIMCIPQKRKLCGIEKQVITQYPVFKVTVNINNKKHYLLAKGIQETRIKVTLSKSSKNKCVFKGIAKTNTKLVTVKLFRSLKVGKKLLADQIAPRNLY